MKRLLAPAIAIALAATAFWFRGHWLPAPPGQTGYLGYVEGRTVLIASPRAGRIAALHAVKGTAIQAGQAVFSLDTREEEAELARAEAAVGTAEATRANLETGKREAELDVIRQQRAEAQAALDMARKELHRASVLAASGVSARQRLDNAEMQVSSLESRIAGLEASEAAALLPARPFELEAAASRIAEAKAEAEVARHRLLELTPTAPVNALVDDTFFEAGEWVMAGQPVASLLAEDMIELRFFVPAGEVARARPGTRVNFSCDSCPEGLTATITHVSAEPEYTPPVIYSETARTKLVFRVEAKPDRAAGLSPGIPVGVEQLP